MKKIALLLSVLSWWAAAADFKTGLDAYNRGDFAAAVREWQPIARSGDPNAQYNLGLLYARGQGVPQDYKQAVEWYQKAANQGVAAAQYNLGVMYANGQGVARDSQEASKWFLQAAQQGVVDAESNLGAIYSEGDGAFRNYSEAGKWYRQAAGKGVASAAFSLGVMYDIGQGVPQDYAEALRWYRQAADAGYAAAVTNIGVLYYNGQGVKRDVVQAYAWLARAQKLGDPRAPDLIAWITPHLKPADIRKAQAQVDQWRPAAPAPAAQAQWFKPQPAPVAQAVAAPAGRQFQDAWTGVHRVVAVGDVHGDYEQFVLALRSAGLVDANGEWTGGRTFLVQAGDVTDRGPDSRAVMDLLMKLEGQAASAGGRVECLIGNHEAMDVYGDLRYVSPAEFAAFASDPQTASRQAASVTAPATPERGAAGAESAPGFAELRAAFGPQGKYGSWIREHNAVIKIDRTLFVHAGLGEKYAGWSLGRINGEVRGELAEFTRLHGGIVTDPDGPLWYNGLAKGDEAQLEPLVDRILKNFGVDRIVVGHTYANGAITPRFHGKVILIDVGLPRVYDNTGKLAVLEIDEGHPYALHRGHRLDLPADENGPGMLRYLREAAALDPQPSPLAARIQQLQK
ncbi:MAG: metallophosphoesterase [Acidobacteriia bacterium]|nr:metallophosphoesterase [Terriglobia bacterium]